MPVTVLADLRFRPHAVEESLAGLDATLPETRAFQGCLGLGARRGAFLSPPKTRSGGSAPAGRALLENARLALEHVSRGIADARAVADAASGQIVVGYSPALRRTAALLAIAYGISPRM